MGQEVLMDNVKRFEEYIDAATAAATHVELGAKCDSWKTFDWVEDTLIELLERHRDECKPELDSEAHRGRK